MKQLSALKAIFTGTLMFGTFVMYAKPKPVNSANYSKSLSQSPLLFTENDGQVADSKGNLRPDVLFTAHSGGAKVFLTATGIHYQFAKTDYPAGYVKDPRRVTDHKLQDALQKQFKTSIHHFSLVLEGANTEPVIIKEEQSAYTENFYLAQCPKGITGVHTYSRIVYENVYPGIDWVVYSKGQGMKYDFIVHPGADPAQIKLKVKDADAISITKRGSLLMNTSLGRVLENAPVSYCGTQQVNTHFAQEGNSISFILGNYDPTQTLTIDPSVSWATYYGGSGEEDVCSCVADGNDNVYLSGCTTSTSGIASNGYQNIYDAVFDAFLVKFDGSGARLWATYYGGSGNDIGFGCAIDNSGNLYMAGETGSSTGITYSGYQNTYGGGTWDAFLAKFNSSGGLEWSTYYGGIYSDEGYGCATDANGNVYLVGSTQSSSGIASGGYQNTYSGGEYSGDAFLAKFSGSGGLIWATYYGGVYDEYGYRCAVDGNEDVYIIGQTSSNTGIASDGFQNIYGGGSSDDFLTKFNASGNLLWATYYGGDGNENTFGGCAIDGNNNVYLAGTTTSASGIASGGFQNTYMDSVDDFLVKFNSSGSRQWATYYGSGIEDLYSCVVDGNNNVYIGGQTTDTSGIAFIGFQNTFGGGNSDDFLVQFSSAGYRQWASYFGGNGGEDGGICAIDGNNDLYFAGFTASTSGIATPGAFQDTFAGNTDAFLAKIGGTVGIENVNNNTIPAKVYPNPATEQFMFEADWDAAYIGKTVNIELIDNAGQNVYTTAVKLSNIHLSVIIPLDKRITAGLYHVRAICGKAEAVQEIVVQR